MWIKAMNGNVFEAVSDELAEGLVKQGHAAFKTEAEARKAKTPKPIAEPVESE